MSGVVRQIVESIEVTPTLADGRFTRHQVENLMREAARAGLRATAGSFVESEVEAARHDMPAELYNDLTEHLLVAAEFQRGAILLLNRLKEQYGVSARKKFGLD